MGLVLVGVSILTFVLVAKASSRTQCKITGAMILLMILPSNPVSAAMIAGWVTAIALGLLVKIIKDVFFKPKAQTQE